MANLDEDQELVLRQQLKAAIHYTCGQICEETGTDLEVKFDRQFIAAVTEITCKQLKSFANDLELFSRHAKRTTISPDDVKLLIRKSPNLHQHISDIQTEMESRKEETKKQGKKTKKKKNTSENLDEED